MFDIDKLKAELCKRSLYQFTQEFWGECDTSVPVWNWHIEYLCNEIQDDIIRVINKSGKLNDIIVNICPGSTKSMIISVMLPAWALAIEPTLKILTASGSSTVAIELSEKCRNIMKSDKYIKYYPKSRLQDDANTKTNYKTVSGGCRTISSTGSNIIGTHFDILIGDDLQNMRTVHSDLERNNTNEWVKSTMSTRKTDKVNSLMIFVQQRLHHLDLTNHLLSLPVKYKHIVLPAKLNTTVKPEVASKYINGFLDPIRLNEEALSLSKAYLGSKNYKAQFDQITTVEGGSTIKEHWLRNNLIKELPKVQPTYFYVLDTAYGEVKSDYSAILECFIHNNNLYVTNLLKINEDFPTLVKTIMKFCNKGNRLFIEGKANGKSVIQQLKSSTKFIIEELTPRDSKLVRLEAISPTVEAGKVFILEGVWNDTLIDEVIEDYPTNDDVRDTFIYAVEQLVKNEDYGQYCIN